MSDQNGYDAIKVAYDLKIRAAERAHDRHDKLEDMFNENSDRHAHAVIRIILTLNGGAGIALLAFAGGLAARTQISFDRVAAITNQLNWFVYGAVVSCVAAVCAYVVSYCYTGNLRFLSRTWEHPFLTRTVKNKWWYRVDSLSTSLGYCSPWVVWHCLFTVCMKCSEQLKA